MRAGPRGGPLVLQARPRQALDPVRRLRQPPHRDTLPAHLADSLAVIQLRSAATGAEFEQVKSVYLILLTKLLRISPSSTLQVS